MASTAPTSGLVLTDPQFIRRLESLYLLARRVLGGSLQADRKTTKKGSGVTFADYAEYSLGDDYRSVDWRVYARLESLMVKLFELEEDTTVYLLLDCSRSMASKFDYARQVAAALGYITLNHMDRLVVYGLGAELSPLSPPSHGRGRVLPMLRALQDASCEGADSRFNDLMPRLQARHRKRGLVIVVSDFFFPDGFEKGLQYLLWNRHDVYALQLQDPAEQVCSVKGEFELECVETGRRRRITITAREAAAYESAVRAWNEKVRLTCAGLGIGFASTTTQTPFDQVIQRILRRGGLVA